MNTPAYLKKIESNLKAFCMTEDIDSLIRASESLRNLIANIEKQNMEKSASMWKQKLETLFNK